MSISAGQIADQGLIGDVREALEQSGLEARLLELGATEDALLYDTARAAHALAGLKSVGVALAVEAFGAGDASFADLQRFPLDALKLHAGRVENVAYDLDKQRYVEGVIALGRALGLAVVATGVTGAADAELLRSSGCAAWQGPIAPHGLSAEECAAVLRERG